MPLGPPEFARRLKELVAGEHQIDVARKLNYTSARVSQMMRGERPSREFVERLIEAYGLNREEWLALADLPRKAKDPITYEPDLESVRIRAAEGPEGWNRLTSQEQEAFRRAIRTLTEGRDE